MTDRAIRNLLRRQNGLITREQAVQAGMSSRRVTLAVQRQEWERLLPRVFHDLTHPLSPLATIRAVHLWAGPESVIGSRAAGYLWKQVPDPPTTIEVVIDPRRHLRPRPGIRVVRRRLDPSSVTSYDGIAVLRPPAALIGTLLETTKDRAGLLDRQLQGHHDLRELTAHLDARRHDRGAADLRRLLLTAADGTEAASERLCTRLLRRHGISGWVSNHPVTVNGHRYRLDLAFLDQRLAIELDGWAFHSTPSTFRRDRARQNELLLDGWLVLRFTWHDLVRAPDRVVAEIQAALAARSSR